MSERNKVIPDAMLSKEFLSQFKTEADVNKFLKQLHSYVLEKMLEGEMDGHLGYEKNSVVGNNSGNSRNEKYPKKIQTEHGEFVISIPRNRNGEFEPIVILKHESRGLSIDKKEFTADMKNIYNAPNKEAAAMELDNLEKKWGGNIPMPSYPGDAIGMT